MHNEMNSNRNQFNLDLTDDEFVRLHAAASAEGLEVNDFIVATLRKHAKIVADIETQQNGGTPPSAVQDG
jgi:uncharacterized protein (DUF1778 family)